MAMIATAQHLEAADQSLRTVCQSLLNVAADDPSVYSVKPARKVIKVRALKSLKDAVK